MPPSTSSVPTQKGRFQTNLLSSLTADVDSAVAWLADLGIDWRSTRIGRYVELHKRFAEGTADVRNKILENDRIAIYNATFELDDLLGVHRVLGEQYGEFIRKRVVSFVGGPERYPSEHPGTSSNRARNLGFELRLLTSLVQAGLKPDFSIPGDIAGQFGIAGQLEARTLLFECKRPQRMEAVTKLIQDGVRQLDRTKSTLNRVRVRGLVAVDSSKLANPNLDLPAYQDRDHLTSDFNERAKAVSSEIRRRWPNTSLRSASALLVNHREVGLVPSRDGPDPYVNETAIIIELPGCSNLDGMILRELLKNLQPAHFKS